MLRVGIYGVLVIRVTGFSGAGASGTGFSTRLSVIPKSVSAGRSKRAALEWDFGFFRISKTRNIRRDSN